MKVSELKAQLDNLPNEAEVVLDTTIVMGNYEKCLSLDLVTVFNDGSLVILTSIPDKMAPQPDYPREGSDVV